MVVADFAISRTECVLLMLIHPIHSICFGLMFSALEITAKTATAETTNCMSAK